MFDDKKDAQCIFLSYLAGSFHPSLIVENAGGLLVTRKR
jgi:hypothetical protein